MRAPRKPQPPHPAPPTGPHTKDTTFRLQSPQKGKDARTAAPTNSALVPLQRTRRPSLRIPCPSRCPPPPPSRPQQEELHRRLRAQEQLFPGSSQHPSLGPPSQGQRRMLLRTSAAPRGRCSPGSAPGGSKATPLLLLLHAHAWAGRYQGASWVIPPSPEPRFQP